MRNCVDCHTTEGTHDWLPYAEYMLEVMETACEFRNQNENGGYSERPDYRPVTRFEKRGQRLGHAVRDLVYRRVGPEIP